MDQELITSIVAIATAVWTAWQEWRHRKQKKASLNDIMPPKKVR